MAHLPVRLCCHDGRFARLAQKSMVQRPQLRSFWPISPFWRAALAALPERPYINRWLNEIPRQSAVLSKKFGIFSELSRLSFLHMSSSLAFFTNAYRILRRLTGQRPSGLSSLSVCRHLRNTSSELRIPFSFRPRSEHMSLT